MDAERSRAAKSPEFFACEAQREQQQQTGEASSAHAEAAFGPCLCPRSADGPVTPLRERGAIRRRALTAAAFLLAVGALPMAVSPPALAGHQQQKAKKPLFRDFIGLNVHTVQFKPEIYQPVTRLVRDYHGLIWDVGDDPATPTQFPLAHNRVDWGGMYGSWVKAGYEINVSVMFGGIPQEAWKDIPRDAYAYGLAFGKFFGPSGANKLATSVEIGNEPGHYDDTTYRKVFENMAKGIRESDPKLRIVTCAVRVGESGKYHKSLSTVKGLESLYDIINLHTYAEAEPYPTWRRSYPEDPRLDYLKVIDETIAWRNANAPGKPVWVTEFGWDATTKPQEKEGTFKDWVGSTETEQARYLVRSFLVFSERDMERAYIYWFNDNDTPHVHGSSGLTRNYVPKPAFHAVAHLKAALGDYRFARVVTKKPGELYVYEFTHATKPKRRILAAWSPTGMDRRQEATLPLPKGAKVEKAQRMPLKAGAPELVQWKAVGKDAVRITVDESPLYLWMRMP